MWEFDIQNAEMLLSVCCLRAGYRVYLLFASDIFWRQQKRQHVSWSLGWADTKLSAAFCVQLQFPLSCTVCDAVIILHPLSEDELTCSGSLNLPFYLSSRHSLEMAARFLLKRPTLAIVDIDYDIGIDWLFSLQHWLCCNSRALLDSQKKAFVKAALFWAAWLASDYYRKTFLLYNHTCHCFKK